MRFKLLLVSFLAVATFVAANHGIQHLSRGIALTNQWAMAAFFWSNLPDTPAPPASSDNPARSVTFRVDNQEEFRWQGRVQAGQTLDVKGVNGSVHAEGSSGNQVEVVAVKKSQRSNTKDVEIRVLEHAGGVTICAVYPSDDPSRPNDCGPGGTGRMNVRDNDVTVDFTVKVPAGVRFNGRTVNGDVYAERIEADVVANTVNGSIGVSSSGIVEAKTVNGSIKAAMGQANWTSDLSFMTVNGDITLLFPASLNADLRAETLNGDVNSDFPLNVQSVQEVKPGRPKRVNSTIGAGGRTLTIKTVNGEIQLRRGGERNF